MPTNDSENGGQGPVDQTEFTDIGTLVATSRIS